MATTSTQVVGVVVAAMSRWLLVPGGRGHAVDATGGVVVITGGLVVKDVGGGDSCVIDADGGGGRGSRRHC